MFDSPISLTSRRGVGGGGGGGGAANDISDHLR